MFTTAKVSKTEHKLQSSMITYLAFIFYNECSYLHRLFFNPRAHLQYTYKNTSYASQTVLRC